MLHPTTTVLRTNVDYCRTIVSQVICPVTDLGVCADAAGVRAPAVLPAGYTSPVGCIHPGSLGGDWTGVLPGRDLGRGRECVQLDGPLHDRDHRGSAVPSTRRRPRSDRTFMEAAWAWPGSWRNWEALTGDPEFRRTALAATARSLGQIDRFPEAAGIPVSYFSGLVGAVFAVDRVAALTGETALDEQVDRLLVRVAVGVTSPHVLDVIGGNAGAIPALLARAVTDGGPSPAAWPSNWAKSCSTPRSVRDPSGRGRSRGRPGQKSALSRSPDSPMATAALDTLLALYAATGRRDLPGRGTRGIPV